MRNFLEESDAASLRARHHLCTREIAAQKSWTTLQDTGGRAPDVSSRPSTSRRSGEWVRKSTPPAAVAISSVAPGAVRSNRSDKKAIPGSDGGCLTPSLRPPSPCLNLDALSSDESTGPGDISAVPISILDDSSTPFNPDQVLSDDDLPTAVHADDRRQVIRICDVPPDVQVVGLSQDDQICGSVGSGATAIYSGW